MNTIVKILLPRILQALLAMFNPNSRTFWLGVANWVATFVVTHFKWLNIDPETIKLWITGTLAVVVGQLVGKVIHGAFPDLKYGTLTPPQATMPTEPGTPVVATVPATAKLADRANENVPTSPVKK